jgi:PAS domain S-box-containing protein
MQGFDALTLVFLPAIVGLLQTLILLLLAAFVLQHYQGVGAWVWTAAGYALGFALFVPSLVLASPWLVVAANSALLSAGALNLYALNRFFARPRPAQERLALALLIVTMAAQVLITLQTPERLGRVLVVNLAIAALLAMGVWSLLRAAPPDLRMLGRLTAGVFALGSLWYGVRAIIALAVALSGRAEPALIGVLSLIASLIFQLFWMAGVVALIAGRLVSDLSQAQASERATLERAARDANHRAEETRELLEALTAANQIVREREAMLRGISDNLPNGLIYQMERMPDGTARFHYISAGVESLWGVTAAEVYADPESVWSRIHPEDRPAFEQAARKAREKLSLFEAELRIIMPDGRIRWSNSRSTAHPLANGRVLRNGIELDITAQKQAEEALRRRIEALLALSQITQALTTWTNLGEGLTTVSALLRPLFMASSVTVWAYDAAHQRLRPLLAGPGQVALPLDEGLPEPELIQRSAAMVLHLADGHPLLGDAQALGAARPALLLPLRARSAPVGLLCIGAQTTAQLYTPDQVALAQTVADVLAGALDNARLYAQAQLAAAEQERRRLARELHDSVSQALFAANRTAELLPQLWELDPDEGRAALNDLHRFTASALAEMRALLVELHPRALVEAPLHESLSLLARAAAARGSTGVSTSFVVVPLLPPEVQMALYRLTQEALNNVLRHARARQVWVRLLVKPPPPPAAPWRGQVTISVADNGRGFDPDARYTGRMGLTMMGERAADVGATIELSSAPGAGTEIRVCWQGAAVSNEEQIAV